MTIIFQMGCPTSLQFAVIISVLFLPAAVLARRNTRPFLGRLNVTVYYEALCPGSRDFITKHLYGAMMKRGFLEYTNLKFVPFGIVKYDRTTKEYKCQHGNKECDMNANHACIIENYSPDEQMEMINCLMKKNSKMNKCAENLGIDIKAAEECKNTRSIPEILHKYGKQTHYNQIHAVPTVQIDEDLDSSENHVNLFKHFSRVFCAKYAKKYLMMLENCD